LIVCVRIDWKAQTLAHGESPSFRFVFGGCLGSSGVGFSLNRPITNQGKANAISEQKKPPPKAKNAT
jgi:hypothetical protein